MCVYRMVATVFLLALVVPPGRGQTQVFPQWTARFHVQNALNGPADSPLKSIATDSEGNTFIAHTVCLDVTVSCPDTESLTIKYDADGRLQWKAWLSGPIHQARSVAVGVDAAGNAYVLAVIVLSTDTSGGLMDQEFATAKYAPNGTRAWIRFVHNPKRTLQPLGLVVSPQGDVYITGTSWPPRADPDEVLTIKYDTNGNQLWERTDSEFGLIPSDSITGLALDGQENVYIATYQESTGFFSAGVTKYDKDGNIVPGGLGRTGIAGVIDVLRVDNQGNVYVSGRTIPDNSNVSGHGIIQKVDAAGNLVWSKDYGAIDIAPDSRGNLFVATLPDGTLGKLDRSGVQLWSAPVTDSPINLAVNAFGDVYLAGFHNVTKYSLAGKKLWEQPFAGDVATMAIGGDGGLLLTGPVTVGAGPSNDWITTDYVQDAAKLAPTTLDFGNQAVKTQSASRTVTLTNTSEIFLDITSVSVTGDFQRANHCPASLAPAASCMLSVTFTPDSLGPRTGTLWSSMSGRAVPRR